MPRSPRPLAVVCLMGLIASAAWAEGTKTEGQIAAQPLAGALKEFAARTGLQVVYGAELARGMESKGAPAGLSVDETLRELLRGTGLEFEFVAERTVAIREKGAPKNTADATPQVMRMAHAGFLRNTGTPDESSSRSQASSAPRSAADSADEAKREGRLEEIIVTATKRQEKLMDIPVSVTAITAEEISRRGLISSSDYLRGIPGVNQVDLEGFGQTITIRGIESSPAIQNFGSGATTATYFGEAPTTSSAGINAGTNVDIKLVDIERVEVLRGPQGTAFGNSSMGGAVRTIPVAPKLDRYEARLGAGYSFTSGTGGDNHMIQAVGNAPLLEGKLAVRGTAYKFDDSGFYRNVAGSNPAFQAGWVEPLGAQAFATDEEHVGATRTTGGRLAALYQATEKLRFTLGYLTQKTQMDGWAGANIGTYEQANLQVAPEHVRRGEPGGISDNDISIANAVVEYDLGWSDVLATYSYVKGGTFYSLPYTLDLTPWALSTLGDSDHHEHVGEVRLATKFSGPWNFLVGLYAEDLDDKVVWNYTWYGDPAANIFAPGTRLGGDDVDRRSLRQKAAFGEVSWKFLPGLTLTGGVRTYRYDRNVRVDTDGPLFSLTSTRNDADASGTRLRGNLSYKPREGTLIYAGWAQGFRLGKPETGLPPGLCDRDNDGIVDGTNISIESTKSVASDTVDSYEVGAKLALADRRVTLEGSAFRMDWSGIPVLVYAGCSNSFNTNAGKARSEGVELQANFQLDRAWSLSAGGSWIDAKLTEDVPAQGFKAGDRLPAAPEVNANLGVQYEFSLAGHNAFVRADGIYVGSFYSGITQPAEFNSGDYVRVDMSARIALDNVDLDLYARNLTNEDAFAFRNVNLLYGGFRLRPRTLGLQLTYNF